MATIFSLNIKNFRGIRELEHTFGDSKFVCLVGRGDSGKTTVLDAISFALNSNWNLQLSDNDFYKGDVNNPIEIEVTLVEVDQRLLQESRYGLHICCLSDDGMSVVQDVQDGSKKTLTILFKVGEDLEPKWYVTSKRPHQDDIEIKAADRATFNVSLLSDYLDKHFTWGKGSPLSQLLKKEGASSGGSILLKEIRDLKEAVDETGFEHLNSVIETVKKCSQRFGVNIENIKTSIDAKDLAIKDSRVVLHNDSVPLRLSGKGTKRIMSAAIQAELSQCGVMLIDEIEQGLEPDRVKHLIRTLLCRKDEQIFITTHSQHAIEELEPENIFVVNNNSGKADIKQFDAKEGEKFKAIFRSCPEALYANKIIVCEGKTEIGFCRSIDKWRVDSGKKSMSAMGVVYIVGGGDEFNRRAQILKADTGKEVVVFCDSDKDEEISSPSKDGLRNQDIQVFDCAQGNNIEKQISVDLPWAGIVELCEYVLSSKKITNKDIKTYIKESTEIDWSDEETADNRQAFFEASTYKKTKDKSWFKRIDHGEVLGDVCIKYFSELEQTSGLKKLISEINDWVDC